MSDVDTPAPRPMNSPASRLRARFDELLAIWEDTERENSTRGEVRAFLRECLERVAAALENEASAANDDRNEASPSITLEPDALTSACRGLVMLREHALSHLARDSAAGERDTRLAERIFDAALHAVLDRIAERREQLARLALEASTASRMHQEAVELRERMLSIVSHDMRTRLAAIDLGGAVLLELPSTRGDPFVQKQINIIRRNVERMSRSIRDLLDMSSIHAGRLSLERKLCSIAQLIMDGVNAMQPAAREKNVALRCDLQVGDEMAHCDPERMHSVLSHLIGNALKFGEPGAEIRIEARVEGDEVRVEISDSGPGIAEADLPHVFNVFWKGKGHRGSGLGLYVAHGIVEAHGGRIGAERNESKGTTFWFSLPLKRTPAHHSEP